MMRMRALREGVADAAGWWVGPRTGTVAVLRGAAAAHAAPARDQAPGEHSAPDSSRSRPSQPPTYPSEQVAMARPPDRSPCTCCFGPRSQPPRGVQKQSLLSMPPTRHAPTSEALRTAATALAAPHRNQAQGRGVPVGQVPYNPAGGARVSAVRPLMLPSVQKSLLSPAAAPRAPPYYAVSSHPAPHAAPAPAAPSARVSA